MRLLPIRVKYFKPGETVAVLYLHQGRNEKPEICERIVEKIGRKYVTDNRGARYCQEPYLAEGLVESADFGERGYLFLTKKEAQDYIDKYNLAIWISNISFREAREYSLYRLREVYEILKR